MNNFLCTKNKNACNITMKNNLIKACESHRVTRIFGMGNKTLVVVFAVDYDFVNRNHCIEMGFRNKKSLFIPSYQSRSYLVIKAVFA